MKKLLFSCLLALGIGAHAQYNVLENFEGPANGRIFFGNGATNTTVFCSSTTSWSATIGTGTGSQVGYGISFADRTTPQTTLGQAINVSVNYRKTSGAGTLYLAYYVFDPGLNQWSVNTFASKTIAAAAVGTCTSFAGTIPAGTLDESSLAPGAKFAIGTFFVRSTGSGILYIDDLSIVEDIVATIPVCTTVTTPANGAVVPAGGYAITWTAVPTATKYAVYLGTTTGGSDVYNGVVSGTSLFVPLTINTNYFLKVVPQNANGSATGCTEIPFSTNAVVAYCSAGAVSTSFEKISKVQFGTINNSSTGTAGYEDFTGVSTILNKESSYTATVTVSADYYAPDHTMVWIDYNQDGIFDDATEKTMLSNSNPGTGSITIPSTALLGNTRMRVRLNDSGSTPSNETACGNSQFGQVEDYTVEIKATLATSAVNKAQVSVYPNPFTDVLTISDVKGVKSISVSDVSGRQVQNLAPSTELNLSGLKTGLYIVTLNMADGTVKSFKAVKK